jgi:uncharacterized SAM-binding protein YcdF (DUF218 family)
VKRPRRKGLLPFLFAAAAALAVLFLLRGPILAALGNFLVVRDQPAPADAIIVLSGQPAERVREAADLYREGFAPLVVLTTPVPPPGHDELLELGVAIPLEVDVATMVALKLGVAADDLLVLEKKVDSTRDEAEFFAEWCRQRDCGKVIVVTSSYHTRRAGSVFRKALGEGGDEVLVLPSRYGVFDPGGWWKDRSQIRTLIFEYQKLLFYAFGL